MRASRARAAACSWATWSATGADPAPVLDIVAEQVAAHGAIALRGNHDEAAIADENTLMVPEARGHRLDARPAHGRARGLPGRACR